MSSIKVVGMHLLTRIQATTASDGSKNDHGGRTRLENGEARNRLPSHHRLVPVYVEELGKLSAYYDRRAEGHG